ncbi:hypothetical protein BCV69DRAFT_81441 [Microstroma glucosiphilum]|uniref:FHA domain-containing protein n=1 Tax=Pseudomicrostroma glucosiphilum TaxID=1684307 RepID=A0A316U5S0_9BASI|nr:hypothetical protein BCV69DRAFT_81441 [Pseudomicrostroma glucosiphilum]PWN18305.1 hypothetical protein BCV69DRAFT_81441 [Pseudomicrostroma glucosiphilum]
MEISKHHCNLFEMKDQDGTPSFFVSDTGSTYGTFVLPAAAAANSGASHISTSSFDRLSDAKKASTPRRLNHCDLVRVAKTTFEVHIHTWPYLSCDRCSLNEAASNEIKTIATAAARSSMPATSEDSSSTVTATPDSARYVSGGLRGKGDRRLDAESERRRQMAELQSSYLSASQNKRERPTSARSSPTVGPRPSPGPEGGAPRPAYRDRAAQRRALHVSESGDMAGHRQGPSRQRSYPTTSAPSTPGAGLRIDSESKTRLEAQPIQPLGDNNRGYQLYKQMYSSSQSDPESGPVREGKLVLPTVMEGRAGIGSRPLVDPHEQQPHQMESREAQHRGQASDWKLRLDQSKRRRWDEAQELADSESKT